MTLKEMEYDFEHIEDAYTSLEKRKIAEKYGVGSVKRADIQHVILLEIRKERQSRSKETWTENDVLWFLRLHDYPYSTQKWNKSMEGESREWMEFVLDAEMRHAKREDQRKNANRLKNAIKEKYYENDSLENKLFLLLDEITSEFRKECVEAYVMHHIASFEEYSKIKGISQRDAISLFGGVEDRRYRTTVKDHLFNNGKSILFMGHRLEPSVVPVSAYYNEDGYEGFAYKPNERCGKVMRKLNEISLESNSWDEKFYEKRKRNEADKAFTSKLKALTDKILKYNLNLDRLKIDHIDTDPKIFEAYITDGTTTLYARSILAAEFSSYMVPHYRFIITKKSAY